MRYIVFLSDISVLIYRIAKMASLKGVNVYPVILLFFYIIQLQQVTSVTLTYPTRPSTIGITTDTVSTDLLTVQAVTTTRATTSTPITTSITTVATKPITSTEPKTFSSVQVASETTSITSSNVKSTFVNPKLPTTYEYTEPTADTTFEFTSISRTTESENSTVSATSPRSERDVKSNIGMIIGVVIAGVALIGIVIGAVLFHRNRVKKRTRRDQSAPRQTHYDRGGVNDSTTVTYPNVTYGDEDVRPHSDIYINVPSQKKILHSEHPAVDNDARADLPIYSNTPAYENREVRNPIHGIGESPNQFQPYAANNIQSPSSDLHLYSNVNMTAQTIEPEYINVDRKLTENVKPDDIYETPVRSTRGLDKDNYSALKF